MKKGSKMTIEQRLRLSKSKIGSIPWNKGKKNIYSKETIEKIRVGNKGKLPWNTGEKWDIAIREKISKSNKGRIVTYTPFIKGHIPWNKGKKHSEATKQKIREKYIQNFKNRKFKDTKIEIKMEEELKRRNIYYEKQVPLCKVAVVDFYLPQFRIVIECDGDYWHNLPKNKNNDINQDVILTFNGFNVYHFWEHEINKNVSNCVDIIGGI